MDFRILGQLEIWSDGTRIGLRGARQERLLAVLLLDVGRVVSMDRLIATGWEEDPPTTARHQVQNLIAQVRRILVAAGAAPTIIGTERAGYRAEVAADDLDAARFERLIRSAGAELPHDTEAAVNALRQALQLWRGEPLAGLTGTVMQTAAAHWVQRQLAVTEECLDLELRLGRQTQVVAEIGDLAQRHPFREQLTQLHMLALYRCGRQVEALDAYRKLRERLVEELGVEPGAPLRLLNEAVLRADPQLEPPSAVGPLTWLPGPVKVNRRVLNR